MKANFLQYRTIRYLKYSVFMSLLPCPSEWMRLYCLYSVYLYNEIFYFSLKSWHKLQLKNNCTHGTWSLKTSLSKSFLLSAEPFHSWFILFPAFWFRTLLPRATNSVYGVPLTCSPLDNNKCQSNQIRRSVSSVTSGYQGRYWEPQVTLFVCVHKVPVERNKLKIYCASSNLVPQMILDKVHITTEFKVHSMFFMKQNKRQVHSKGLWIYCLCNTLWELLIFQYH